MHEIHFKLKGERPLLMHNVRVLIDPLHPLTRKLKELTSKRNKTDDDMLEIAHLEFSGGLYWSDNPGPYIPADMILANWAKAAASKKLRPQVQRGVDITEDEIPLVYKGPRSIEELWQDRKFVDIRPVRLRGQVTLQRCRAIFSEWGLEFAAIYDPIIINRDRVIEIARIGGELGLCDHRPRYGCYSVEAK